jgi:hypothetical protein
MSMLSSLAGLVGNWRGLNRLWLSSAAQVRESETTCVVAAAAQGEFLTFQYTWSDEGTPQDGLLLVGYETQSKTVRAVWIDSWHLHDQYMLCTGTAGAQGSISLQGTYAASPGPDWGWQIEITPQDDNLFDLVMRNVSPQGKADLAVEARYVRQRRGTRLTGQRKG